MLRKVLAVTVALTCMCALPALGAENARTKILDEQIFPLLKQFGAEPSQEKLRILGRAVDTLNRTPVSTAPAADEAVKSINPLWLSTQLREQTEKGFTAAVLSLCGTGLHPCDAAMERLMTLTAQCSSVFRAIIDVDKYPGTPHNLYDTADPELILMLPDPDTKVLTPVNPMATVNPDTVAVMLCPRESRTFGPALRMLQR